MFLSSSFIDNLYCTTKPVLSSWFNIEFYQSSLYCRYLMFTILRDPIDRYVSEYLHTARGATWSGAKLRYKWVRGVCVPPPPYKTFCQLFRKISAQVSSFNWHSSAACPMISKLDEWLIYVYLRTTVSMLSGHDCIFKADGASLLLFLKLSPFLLFSIIVLLTEKLWD